MEEWLENWQEGIDGLNTVSVELERFKHNLNIMEERLDYLDALAAQI